MKLEASQTVTLQTAYGELSVVYHPAPKHGAAHWIFARFAEPKRARKRFSCNPHTGKYNFYDKDPDLLFADFNRFLREVNV